MGEKSWAERDALGLTSISVSLSLFLQAAVGRM